MLLELYVVHLELCTRVGGEMKQLLQNFRGGEVIPYSRLLTTVAQEEQRFAKG